MGRVTGFTDFITRKGAEGKEEREGSDKAKEVLGGIGELLYATQVSQFSR